MESLPAGKRFTSVPRATDFVVLSTVMHQTLKPAQTDRWTVKAAEPPAYSSWAPRFWHGMNFTTWMRLLWRNRFAVAPNRITMTASITASSMSHSFGGIFERLVLGHQVSQTKLAAPPLFVLGHWRSGTT
ncbi:MAG TPA: hypothetical protein VGM76_07105, partial [Lacipirellulaceae bacterium]